MKWSNVKLVFLREVRDQLRDRRMLFMIAVLPLLLYPLLGMTFLRITQFKEEQPTKVWLVGAGALPESPKLLDGDKFSGDFVSAETGRLLELTLHDQLPERIQDAVDFLNEHNEVTTNRQGDEQYRALIQGELEARDFDVLVYFPPGFAAALGQLRRPTDDGPPDEGAPNGSAASGQQRLQIKMFVNTASDKSRIARNRVERILELWRSAIVRQKLKENRIPIAAAQPFEMVEADVAAEVSRRASIWSKILPFVVLVWALTGAFYPAIDLCAGEKERGTLETLLSSPAERSEIAWGKLLTIMAFSMATSLLNLLSMGVTGLLIIQQLAQSTPAGQLPIGPPPLASMGWLVLAMIPLSALFSAVSLAIAAFARSTKEGQYYLMPVLLITLPLMLLPMMPAVEFNLGISLIPVTGMMLLLRALIEGQYADALRYCVPVLAVTGACCLLSIRWVIDQFNNESVLFRETERFGLGLWLRHLIRDRGETPTFGEGVLCGVLLLVIGFFASLFLQLPNTWSDFVVSTLTLQIAMIATPALLMAIMLTRSPRKTLLLRMPPLFSIPAAVLLAVVLHPATVAIGHGVRWLYPISEAVKEQMDKLGEVFGAAPSPWLVLVLIALVPAICEELAFRGFILSGLRHMGHKWAAIIISSMFFGAAHFMLQQSITACLIGIVIGYIAVQTRSLLPCILFHFTNNALTLLAANITQETIQQYPVLGHLISRTGFELAYQWPAVVVGSVLAAGILFWLWRLPFQPSAEERLQQALDHQSAHAPAK